MFSLASGLYAEYFSPQQINLLVVGVQGSGKTTILERIKVTQFAAQSVTLSSANKNSSIVDDTAIAAAAAAAAVTAAQSSKEYKNSNNNNNNNNIGSNNHSSTHNNNNNNNKNTIGPTPELLRSKVFMTNSTDDYQAPTTKRRRTKHSNLNHATASSSTTATGHVSRFGWICPPPPKFLLSQRLDTSDRSSNHNLRYSYNDDDEFSNDGFDQAMVDQFWDENDDDDTDRNDDEDTMDTTLLSTTTASARSRRTAMASATTNNTLTINNSRISNSQHNNSNTANNSQHGIINNGGPMGLPPPRRITTTTGNGNNDDLRKSSMESIDLNDRQRYMSSSSSSQQQQQKSLHGRGDNHDHDDMETNDGYGNGHAEIRQYDIKAHAKMLSLEKIRPTIGMNLSKNEICGAKVHVWDLGGKLQDLWERYYDDADAVLFVWRLNRQDVVSAQQQRPTDNLHHDQEEDTVRVTAEQQMKVLEHVRSSVPDDIPFCLLGNLFQLQPPYNCEPDVLYSTDHLLPHYHNPLQALFIANAVSGQGIKTAIEWLISTAKRQQRIRKRSTDHE